MTDTASELAKCIRAEGRGLYERNAPPAEFLNWLQAIEAELRLHATSGKLDRSHEAVIVFLQETVCREWIANQLGDEQVRREHAHYQKLTHLYFLLEGVKNFLVK